MRKGFTLPELIVVMGILAILFGFIIVNIAGIQRRVALDTTMTKFISDLKSQQVKAMGGIIETPITSHYGLFLDSNRYILFQGSVFDPLDSSNFVIDLDFNIQITPSQAIIFQPRSGEINGYDSGFASTIVFENTTVGQTLSLTINRYGVITQTN